MPARRATRTRRPARGSAREALLDATLQLVRRQGWAATSVDQLCATTGVTKGAFFHHFPSKEALGVAAAERWTQVTAPAFAGAPYQQLTDPLERVLGYLDFRIALAQRPLDECTCFAGTTVQEVFATSPAMRDALGESMHGHARTLVADLRAALARVHPKPNVTAESLAVYTQTVLQGGFVMAKASGKRAPLVDAVNHLKQYLRLLFRKDAP